MQEGAANVTGLVPTNWASVTVMISCMRLQWELDPSKSPALCPDLGTGNSSSGPLVVELDQGSASSREVPTGVRSMVLLRLLR